MQNTKLRKNKIIKAWVVLSILLALVNFYSCNEGGGGDSDSSPGSPVVAQESAWQRTSIRSVNTTGLLIANLKVMADSSDRLHVVHYGDSGDDAYPYAIEHSVWDLSFRQLEPLAETVVVTTLDNSLTVDLALGNDGNPVIVYQGGEFRE